MPLLSHREAQFMRFLITQADEGQGCNILSNALSVADATESESNFKSDTE